MVKKITLYYHDMCDGCEEAKPLIAALAKEKGWEYEEKNIEYCEDERCEDIEFVPAIYLDNRKLSIEEMSKVLDWK